MMRADEFLRRYAPSPDAMRTQHDQVNEAELERLADRFTGDEPVDHPDIPARE